MKPQPDTLDTPNTRVQKARILSHLKSGQAIDLQTSLRLYNCAGLRSRIADLRKEGWPIKTDMVRFVAPSGHHGAYAVYSLAPGAERQEAAQAARGEKVCRNCVHWGCMWFHGKSIHKVGETGQGCKALIVNTPADFGCNRFCQK